MKFVTHPLAVCGWLLAAQPAPANVSFTGWISNPDGSVTYDWVTATPGGAPMWVGFAGNASLLLDDQLDGNGVTRINCTGTLVACGVGSVASLTLRGGGCLLSGGNLTVAAGSGSSGTFTMAEGALWEDPTYINRYIYIGSGAGSRGLMWLKDPGTSLLLADRLYLGMAELATGQLTVEGGASCEVDALYCGYQARAEGRVVVRGTGSKLSSWGNDRSVIGWTGMGWLTVREGGLADLKYLDIGHAGGSRGEVLVTGGGSRLECHYGAISVGRGDSAAGLPGVGILRLARGGVVATDVPLYVGYSTYNPHGTMVFVIGDDGSGVIRPGRAETTDLLLLNQAWLEMEVDPGITLPLGSRFVLIDYTSLGRSSPVINARFQGVPEDGIVTTPNHHAFRINYATDLGDGDLAVTATVVEPPATDGDNDGLTDLWEVRCFGSSDAPQAEPGLDPDGDGQDNACEYAAGTDPLDPLSCCRAGLAAAVDTAAWILAYAPYEPGASYHVERSDGMGGPWAVVLPTATSAAAGTISFTLPGGAGGRAFYRVRIER